MDQAGLIEQAVGGDREALGELLQQHYDELESSVYSRLQRVQSTLRRELDPSDIVQKTFLRAMRSIASFRPRHEHSFSAWLRQIAKNTLLDELDRRNRENTITNAQPGGEQDDVPSGWEANLADSSSQVSKALDPVFVDAFVSRAMLMLSEREREALKRYYLQGQSTAQTAAALGMSPGALRGVLYRGLEKLRAQCVRLSLSQWASIQRPPAGHDGPEGD